MSSTTKMSSRDRYLVIHTDEELMFAYSVVRALDLGKRG
jgi:hypothetical protein